MKSFRWTWVFASLVAVLAGYTAYDHKNSAETEVRTEQEQKVVMTSVDQINGVELVSKSNHIILKQLDAWVIASPIQGPADQQAVQSFLDSIESEKRVSVVDEGETLNLQTYGLDNPVSRLKISSRDGKIQEIKIGRVPAYDGSLYAQRDNEKKVILVGSTWDAHLAKSVDDFRNKRLFGASENKIKVARLKVRSPAGAFELTKKEGQWHDPLVDGELVQKYLEQVEALRGQKFVSSDKREVRPETEIQLYTDQVKPAFSLFIAPAKGDQHLATSSAVDGVLSVYGAAVKTLQIGLTDLYDKRGPFRFNQADIALVKINSPWGAGEFKKLSNSWEVAKPGLQTTIASTQLNDLVTKLSQMEAVRFLGTKPFKPTSSLEIIKANGEKIFEMSWGESVIDTGKAGQGTEPEMTYVPARTSVTTAQTLALPEITLKSLFGVTK